MREHRVSILVPCDDLVRTEFMQSLVSMVQQTCCTESSCVELMFRRHGSSLLPKSREELAQAAVEQNSTHALWIDSDMDFPSDMLLRFLRRPEAIVGINAATRKPPYRCTAETAPGVPVVTTPDSEGLLEVYKMGFGVVWMNVDVLRRMKSPRFMIDCTEERGWIGEDVYFCDRAKALGYPLYIDQSLSRQVFHVGNFGVLPQMVTDAGPQ